MAPERSSASDDDEEESNGEVTATKKTNVSSSAPKPSSASTAPATKGPKPKPSSSSSEEDEESSDDGEEEGSTSDSGDNRSNLPPHPPLKSTTAEASESPKPKPSSSKPSSSSSEEDEESRDGGDEEEGSTSDSGDNRSNLPPHPPLKSTTAEASESGSTDDSDSEPSDQPPPPTPRVPDPSTSNSGDNRSNLPPHPPLKSTTAESSESGSADDSDSEPSDQPPPPTPRVPDPSIKPLAMDGPPSKRRTTPPTNKKQNVPEASLLDESGQKRQLFQRIWSDDDEIAVLRGMLSYQAKNSSTDMGEFYDFMHKSLKVEINKRQLADKLRRLKKKYVTAATRVKNGKDPSFTKTHERTVYELSKRMWGANKVVAAARDLKDHSARKRRKIKAEPSVPSTTAMITDGQYDPVKGKIPCPLLRQAVFEMADQHHSGLVAKMALELVADSKVIVLEDKYKKLSLSKMKLDLHRMDIMNEMVSMAMKAMEKSS